MSRSLNISGRASILKEMPRIQLKPNSPEFADGAKRSPRTHACQMPGCPEAGEFRAPKARESNEYLYFCLPHVQEYNKSWNYFSGMSDAEVEQHIIRSALWDRPTRSFHNYAELKEELQRKAWQTYTGSEKPRDRNGDSYRKSQISKHSPEFEAMAIMGLEPPIDPAGLKARYKDLVKRYHPDVNRDDPNAEEMLKNINMAYTILQAAQEKFAAMAAKDNSI